MGIDQQIVKTRPNNAAGDFSLKDIGDTWEVYYAHNFRALQQFMEKLARIKGYTGDRFYDIELRLDEHDIAKLAREVIRMTDPKRDNPYHERGRLFKAIGECYEALDDEYELYYYSG